MFLAPALCCCGFLTFAPFLYMGLKAKRRSWLIAAAVYGAGLAVGCLIMTAFGDSSSETQTAGESVGATIILAGNIPGVTQTSPLAIYDYTNTSGGDRMALNLCLV